MLQKILLQRVNQIGKLTVGMLTLKEGRDCPSGWTGDDWLASPIGTANAPFFFTHAHKVAHSSQPISTAADIPCNVLWWHDLQENRNGQQVCMSPTIHINHQHVF